MSGKKKRNKNSKPSDAIVRLSQCMIVKNEEKNIVKALSWAKGIAFEQIVVDTGSTDKTVEIAKQMGAKVYHFEWINDFAAAKNFAIDQAKGNWIALLDADEYFSMEDAAKLSTVLKRIQSDSRQREFALALNCALVNVDDEGKPIGIMNQNRIFRNLPALRYVGKIHENLNLSPENVVKVDDITIIHTGYSESAFKETGKTKRNVELLRVAIADAPSDVNLKAYLGEALLGMDDQVSRKEAEELFLEVIDEALNVTAELKAMAYRRLLEMRIETGERLLESDDLGRRALRDFPGNIDLGYCLAYILNSKQQYKEAFSILQEGEIKLLGSKAIDESVIVSANPAMLFTQLAIAAQGLGNIEDVVKYSSMTLSLYKYQENVLIPYISILRKNGVADADVAELILKMYDLSNANDVKFVARAAQKSGADDLASMLLTVSNESIG